MQAYSFLLDLFPLVEDMSHENAVLAAAIQMTALDQFLPEDPRERLQQLLSLAHDLGYLGNDVAAFLQRELGRL